MHTIRPLLWVLMDVDWRGMHVLWVAMHMVKVLWVAMHIIWVAVHIIWVAVHIIKFLVLHGAPATQLLFPSAHRLLVEAGTGPLLLNVVGPAGCLTDPYRTSQPAASAQLVVYVLRMPSGQSCVEQLLLCCFP